MRIKRRRFRRLQHPWATMRESTPCWALRSLGLEVSAMALCAHGDGAPAQAVRLMSTRNLERLPVYAEVTAQPSQPLKLLPSRIQLIPSPVACHFCIDDGYDKT